LIEILDERNAFNSQKTEFVNIQVEMKSLTFIKLINEYFTDFLHAKILKVKNTKTKQQIELESDQVKALNDKYKQLVRELSEIKNTVTKVNQQN
jgi:hypothetical protein